MKRNSLLSLIRNMGLSIKEVSEHLMVPVATVEDWVLWKSVPSVKECVQISELLGVDLYYVYLALIVP